MNDTEGMDAIHKAMDRNEWNSDLWDLVAQIVYSTGRPGFAEAVIEETGEQLHVGDGVVIDYPENVAGSDVSFRRVYHGFYGTVDRIVNDHKVVVTFEPRPSNTGPWDWTPHPLEVTTQWLITEEAWQEAEDSRREQEAEIRAETFAAEAMLGMRAGTTEGWYDEPEPPDPHEEFWPEEYSPDAHLDAEYEGRFDVQESDLP